MKRRTPHSSSRSEYAISKPRSTALAWTASTSGTSTEMPGAAMSSFPMMVTWAERLVGDATVTTQPRSIATSKPIRSRKKSRVSAGRSDLMLGTARLTVMRVTLDPVHGQQPLLVLGLDLGHDLDVILEPGAAQLAPEQLV